MAGLPAEHISLITGVPSTRLLFSIRASKDTILKSIEGSTEFLSKELSNALIRFISLLI